MGLIPEETISQIIDRSDIVEVVSSYIPLKKAGRNFKANCPFHNEKTPSFIVNPDKQIFHCFGCGVGGNVVSFIMKQERMEFPEAIRLLAQKANVIIPESISQSRTGNQRQEIFRLNELAVEFFHQNLLTGKGAEAKQARHYLKKRGVSLETVKDFKLGLALDEWDGLLTFLKEKQISYGLMEKAGLIIPRSNKEGFYDRFRNRIIFPIFDTRNHCRAFGARIFTKGDSVKYINSPETLIYIKGHHLYGFNLSKDAISQEDFVVVVEGYTDCLIPSQEGLKNIVASLGTALTTEQVRLLRRYTNNVVMLFDMDEAGATAVFRSLDLFIEEGMNVKIAQLDEGDDPDSYVRKKGIESFRAWLDKAQNVFDYKLDVLSSKYDFTSVEGKAKISQEMLLTINKYDSAVIKSGYINLLSKKLIVAEDALVQELNKISKVNLSRRETILSKKNHQEHEASRPVERHMLKFLLEEEKYVGMTKDIVSVTDFQDGKVRDVIKKIYEMFDQSRRIDVGKLINSFEDQSMQEMISSLLATEDIAAGDKEKMYRDYVKRLKKDRLKMLRHELLMQISHAERSGDYDTLDKLKNEFNLLSKK